MRSRLYVCYDRVAQECAPPFLAKNDAQALRMFEKGMENSPDFHDFQLVCLAAFDTETMRIDPLAVPQVVVSPEQEESGL